MDWIDTGNAPEDFVSHIPCSQDGSCSGLQHYSAMLRDQIGGFAVNLVPGLSPRDIYAQVSNLMLLKLKEMALTGVLGFNMPKTMEESNVLDKEEIKAVANGLMRIKNGINRSLTKPPVMTKTYGSTFMRCKDTTHQYFHDLQVKEEKEAAADNRKVVPVHDFNDSGKYNIYTAEFICSKLIWESLNETVTSAVEGMGFIQKLAGYMAKAGSHMEWETPTGFIVEQHAYESKARRVKTQLLGNTRFTILEETKKLDIHKMQSSSSPNFVHSMDASHLVLAVNGFVDAKFSGIAVVHDDFSTHACNTGKLRDILRQTFVDLYKDNNVLAQLLEHNEALLLEEIDIEVPQYGNLDIEQVLKSDYIFG
jgi:DNA-directed RNA polymerase